MEFTQVKRKPLKLYHTDNPLERNSIIKRGIFPGIGASYSEHAYSEFGIDAKYLPPVIFLSSKPYDSTYDDDVYEIDINKIDINSLYYDFDSGMKESYVYTKQIPNNAIKLVYCGDIPNIKYNDWLLKSLSEKIKIVDNNGFIEFYYADDCIGGLIYTIGYTDDIYSEYSDSISDFNSNCLRYFDDFSKIINIEDVWINSNFRGNDFFKIIFKKGVQYLIDKKYKQFILRAHSDNGFPNTKLEQIYKRFGFRTVQKTNEDGIIMIKLI